MYIISKTEKKNTVVVQPGRQIDTTQLFIQPPSQWNGEENRDGKKGKNLWVKIKTV